MNKKLNIKVNMQGAQKATTQIKSLGDRVKGTVSSMTSMANIVRGAFATSLIYGTVNLLKTAGAADGVERAFKRLNKPDLLNNLKSATNGMVSEFDLMKAAVRANNFQIPLEKMGTLLQFAQRRAQETGESVDYLTESIVMGIGRKSVMILDNLGLSAVRVREEFKRTGDMAAAVAKIAGEEMGKMGTYTSTAADDLERLSANLKNLTISVGRGIAGSFIGELIEDLSTAVDKGLLKDFIFDYEMFVQKISAPQKGKFTPDMLFTKTGEAAERARLAMEAAEREYAVWVSGVEEEAAKRKQVAEWQARYNKELAISMGYWNTNPQATADPLMATSHQDEGMAPDMISEEDLKRSKERVENLNIYQKRQAEEIEYRNQQIANNLTNEVMRAWQISSESGKVELGKLFNYLKKRIIEELIYTIISELIKSIVKAYSGSSGWYSALTEATGGEGAITTGDVGARTDSLPSIGGVAEGSMAKTVVNNNITFQGVADKEYIRSTVIPEIKKATRLGLN